MSKCKFTLFRFNFTRRNLNEQSIKYQSYPKSTKIMSQPY